VIVVVAVSPAFIELDAEAIVIVSFETAALDVATGIKPNPSETTTASETRLRIVFKDILFLSVVKSRALPDLAGR